MNFLKRIREGVNIRLYDSRDSVLSILRFLNLFVSLTAIGTILYYYGYPQTLETKELLLSIIKGSFAFYVLNYFIKFLYNYEPKKFLRDNWFEGIMMLLLILEAINYNIFGRLLLEGLFNRIGFIDFVDFSTLFIQFYFFIVVILELSRNSDIIPNVRLHPATVFVSSFLIIIVAGTGLLMMPEMTVDGKGLRFLDAIFTSTSASCVTGLTVVNVSEFFTYKGQVVIMLLIKLGGLNIITFGSFLLLFSKVGLGVRHDKSLESFVNKESLLTTKSLLAKVFFWSLSFELVGAALMYLFWLPDIPDIEQNNQRIFYSVFHSISAFNNAGFSIFNDGFYTANVKSNYLVHIVIIGLVFVGSLGFASIFDLFGINRLRERLRKPWKNIEFSTKIALYFSIILVVAGAIFFYLFEKDNTLGELKNAEAAITATFQSVITRTAGFNSVDIGALSMPAVLLVMALMFIGASSSSTGGGIKTSTFAIIWATIIANVKGRKNVELFQKTIGNELIIRAFVAVSFYVLCITIGSILLAISEDNLINTSKAGMIDIIFEQVSAFCTVGLSRGITSELSDSGRIIIIFSMFIGRVGTLSILYLFGKDSISKNYKYPKAHTMVG